MEREASNCSLLQGSNLAQLPSFLSHSLSALVNPFLRKRPSNYTTGNVRTVLFVLLQAEWIPYWINKLAQLFDMDVLEKTDDLMRKFDLPSVEEPKREDYQRPEEKKPLPEKRKEAPDRSPSGSRRRRRISRSPSPGRRREIQQRGASNERRRRKRSASSASLSPPARQQPQQHHHRESRRRSGSRGRTRNPSPPGHRSTTEIPGLGRTGPSRLASGRSDLYSGGLSKGMFTYFPTG
jgi:hypothetical protein